MLRTITITTFFLGFSALAIASGIVWFLPSAPVDASHLAGLRIAHRGGSAWGPENTLEAIEIAAKRGANAIEVDVWLTADGIPVVLHDGTLDRTTDGRGPVLAIRLEDLQQLDADPHPHRIARVPTLDAVLEAARRLGLKVELELKTELKTPQAVVHALVASVRQHGMADQVWVGSFDPRLVWHLRREAPELVAALCIRTDATGSPWTDAALTSHWLPWVLGVSVIEPHLEMVDAASVRDWRERGYVINAWTANGRVEQSRLAALGVGYTSNCPGADCEDLESDDLE